MKIALGLVDRVRLRQAAYTARGGNVRRRALWVLLIGDGLTVSHISRLAGVSRPTVYRYLKIWLATRDPAALASGGSGRRLARSRVDQEGPAEVEGK